MGCMLLLLEYYGLSVGAAGGGVTMTTELLRGLGVLVEWSRRVRVISLLHACAALAACVRTCASARARRRKVGAGLVLWSVRCEVTMQSPE